MALVTKSAPLRKPICSPAPGLTNSSIVDAGFSFILCLWRVFPWLGDGLVQLRGVPPDLLPDGGPYEAGLVEVGALFDVFCDDLVEASGCAAADQRRPF